MCVCVCVCVCVRVCVCILPALMPELVKLYIFVFPTLTPELVKLYIFVFPILMPELIKLYNSVNSAVDISKIVFFGVIALNSKIENHRGIIYPYSCRNLLQGLCQCLREAEVHYM